MSYGIKCTALSRISVAGPDAHRPPRTAANRTGDALCGQRRSQRKGRRFAPRRALWSPAAAPRGALDVVAEAVGRPTLVGLREQLDVALDRRERGAPLPASPRPTGEHDNDPACSHTVRRIPPPSRSGRPRSAPVTAQASGSL